MDNVDGGGEDSDGATGVIEDDLRIANESPLRGHRSARVYFTIIVTKFARNPYIVCGIRQCENSSQWRQYAAGSCVFGLSLRSSRGRHSVQCLKNCMVSSKQQAKAKKLYLYHIN